MPDDASGPLPDVHAVVLHVQSLSAGAEHSGGVAVALGAATPGVAELVTRLLAARVHVAVLACADAESELHSAQAAAAESAAALSGSDAGAHLTHTACASARTRGA